MSVGLLRLASHHVRRRVAGLALAAALVGLLAGGVLDTGRRLTLHLAHPNDCVRTPSLCQPGQQVHAPLLRNLGRDGDALVVRQQQHEYRLLGIDDLDGLAASGSPLGVVASWSEDRRLTVVRMSVNADTAWKARVSAVMAVAWAAGVGLVLWRRRG